MNFLTVSVAQGESGATPLTLLLWSIALFWVLVLFTGAAAWAIGYYVNKKTEMGGSLQVGVVLNDQQDAGHPYLDYGVFRIAMPDPTNRSGNPLDLKQWVQKAMPRRCPVKLILEDFQKALQEAGLGADPGCVLLKDLLEDSDFCVELGSVFWKNGMLRVSQYGTQLQDGQTGPGKNLTVKYQSGGKGMTLSSDIRQSGRAGTAVGKYRQEAKCGVEDISITITYIEENAHG